MRGAAILDFFINTLLFRILRGMLDLLSRWVSLLWNYRPLLDWTEFPWEVFLGVVCFYREYHFASGKAYLIVLGRSCRNPQQVHQ